MKMKTKSYLHKFCYIDHYWHSQGRYYVKQGPKKNIIYETRRINNEVELEQKENFHIRWILSTLTFIFYKECIKSHNKLPVVLSLHLSEVMGPEKKINDNM